MAESHPSEGADLLAVARVVAQRSDAGEEIEAYVAEAREKLEKVKEDLAGAGLNVRAHVDVGSPREQIKSLAISEEASLIVMSSHGKTWLKQMMVGSTTFDVVRPAERPVLIVRSK